MTQVKEMSHQQLNRALAGLMGYTVNDMNWMGLHQLLKDGIEISRLSSEAHAWADAPDYCTDPAASLEVQTAAIAKDALGYVQALADVMVIDIRSRTLYSISRLLTATPRERAEAAYMTFQFIKG